MLLDLGDVRMLSDKDNWDQMQDILQQGSCRQQGVHCNRRQVPGKRDWHHAPDRMPGALLGTRSSAVSTCGGVRWACASLPVDR